MGGKVLILRPQPGADETAARAAALGLDPVVAPLFTLRPLEWVPPNPRNYDAALITSANAARCGGDALAAFTSLPCYAVGGHSAAAAAGAGFSNIRIGPAGGFELLAIMAADGVRRAFHPCGRDHADLSHPSILLDRVPVYAADAADSLPSQAVQAIEAGAVALVHSPRAAEVLAALIGALRARTRIAAISASAADAAGSGWLGVDVAPVPRDQALLELAVKLCQTERA